MTEQTKIVMELTGHDQQRVIDGVVRLVFERLEDSVNSAINAAIDVRVKELVDSVTEEMVRPEVTRVITEGWAVTNQWGDPTGQRTTIRQRISNFLDGKGDSYDRQTRLEKLVKEAIDGAMSSGLGEEVKRAQKAFREQVDAVLQAKLGESLRTALGMKS